MNQMRRKNPFWSLAAPILIYIGVRLVVEIICILVISLPDLMNVYEQILTQQKTQSVEQITQQYWTLMEPAMNQVFRYSTEIAGVAALVTIPVNAVFFSRQPETGKSLRGGSAGKGAFQEILDSCCVRAGCQYSGYLFLCNG